MRRHFRERHQISKDKFGSRCSTSSCATCRRPLRGGLSVPWTCLARNVPTHAAPRRAPRDCRVIVRSLFAKEAGLSPPGILNDFRTDSQDVGHTSTSSTFTYSPCCEVRPPGREDYGIPSSARMARRPDASVGSAFRCVRSDDAMAVGTVRVSVIGRPNAVSFDVRERLIGCRSRARGFRSPFDRASSSPRRYAAIFTSHRSE